MTEKKFIKSDEGWELQETNKFFLGKQVIVQIDTKTDSEQPDREIFEEQIISLNTIFAKWDELSINIEKEILNYENITKEELQKVLKDPTIHLGMDYDTNLPMDNNQWSFVLGVTESEDFGWHVEFEGITHIDTWAGG